MLLKTIGAMLALATLVVATLTIACGDDEEKGTSGEAMTATATKPTTATSNLTASPTRLASPTSTFSPELSPFGDFARQIDVAVQHQDAEFFSSRGMETHLTCQGGEQIGPCEGQAAGSVISGIPDGLWATDALGYVPRNDFKTLLTQWFAAAAPSQVDGFGNGVPRLAAIAKLNSSGHFFAVVTLMADAGPPTGVQRQTRAFEFQPAPGTGGWQLAGDWFARNSAVAASWLSGQCVGYCYDYFEAW